MGPWKADRSRQAEDSPEPKDGQVIAGDLLGEAGSLVALLPWLPGKGRPHWGCSDAQLSTPGCRWGPRRACCLSPSSFTDRDGEQCPYQAPGPHSLFGAGLPRGSGSLRPRGTGAQGPREEHGPSAELAFSVRDRWARPRPRPFWSRSLAACEARDCGRASTRNLSVPSPSLVLVHSSFIHVGERDGGGARTGSRG